MESFVSYSLKEGTVYEVENRRFTPEGNTKVWFDRDASVFKVNATDFEESLVQLDFDSELSCDEDEEVDAPDMRSALKPNAKEFKPKEVVSKTTLSQPVPAHAKKSSPLSSVDFSVGKYSSLLNDLKSQWDSAPATFLIDDFYDYIDPKIILSDLQDRDKMVSIENSLSTLFYDFRWFVHEITIRKDGKSLVLRGVEGEEDRFCDEPQNPLYSKIRALFRFYHDGNEVYKPHLDFDDEFYLRFVCVLWDIQVPEDYH